MSYSGGPLSTIEVMEAQQVASVFQQVILTLAAAESEFKFEHRHLNLDNVLVKRTFRDVLTWRIKDRVFTVDNFGMNACITNFGASRVQLADGSTLFSNPKVLWQDENNNKKLTEIHTKIRRDIKDNWDVHCPRTNILFANYVAEELFQKHDACITYILTSRDKETWDKFKLWKDQLPWFPSVTDFVEMVFVEPDAETKRSVPHLAYAVLKQTLRSFQKAN
ncbi:hypothetical protein ISCGN_023620 [Ixodes scapularis]